MLQLKDINRLNRYKSKSYIYIGLQETHFRTRNTCRLKVKEWKKNIPCKWKSKESSSSSISIRINDFKIRNITRDEVTTK